MGKDLKGNSLGKGFSQRKDGRYYYRYTNRFGERTKPIYDTSLTRLKRRVKLETSKNDLKLNSKNEQPTLNEFFDMWLNIYKKNTIKETTMKSYENVYNRHLYDTQLGKKQLDKITVLDVKKTYNEIIDADYSQSELGYVKSIIDSMFDLAVAENYVNTNQFKFLKPVSNKRKKKVEPLSKEEQDMFLSYAKGSYYYNLFIFLFNTGLRAGEVAGVLIDDIDLKNRILHVKHNLQYSSSGTFSNGKRYIVTTTKGEDDRNIPLNDAAMKAIELQLKFLNNLKNNEGYIFKTRHRYEEFNEFGNLLFVGANGKPISQASINTIAYDIVDKINFFEEPNFHMNRFSLHVFRHTFATRCLEQGIAYDVIRDLLGHDDIKLTMKTYAKTNPFNSATIKNLNKI